jgi:hypothetical protein
MNRRHSILGINLSKLITPVVDIELLTKEILFKEKHPVGFTSTFSQSDSEI